MQEDEVQSKEDIRRRELKETLGMGDPSNGL